MEQVRVSLEASNYDRSYNIVIEPLILANLGTALKGLNIGKRVAVVTNPTVAPLYAEVLLEGILAAGFSPIVIEIPDGEQYKTLESAETIYERLLAEKFDRKCALIALGGGVIGDLTGFVAATYLRGVPFIQVPTTLLSQVDSSVGGKTGVNHRLGKNMIGAFYQPLLVWIDSSTLSTLARREFIAGMAEVIKYGVIYDEALFSWLEGDMESVLDMNSISLSYIIRRSCEIKGDVVSQDERESGLRAILNFGHTIGHAVETATGYTRYLHGEAVAIGMVCAARLAVAMGLCESGLPDRIKSLLQRAGLPAHLPTDISPSRLVELTQGDKKAVEKKARFVLPVRMGEVIVFADWNEEMLLEVLRTS